MLGLRSRFPWSPFVCNSNRTALTLSMRFVETSPKWRTAYSSTPVVAHECLGFIRESVSTIVSSTTFVHRINSESESIVKKRTHRAHFKLTRLPPEIATQSPHPWHC